MYDFLVYWKMEFQKGLKMEQTGPCSVHPKHNFEFIGRNKGRNASEGAEMEAKWKFQDKLQQNMEQNFRVSRTIRIQKYTYL